MTEDCLLPTLVINLPKPVAVVSDTRTLPYQNSKCFHKASLIRIAHRRLAIWLDPLGVLAPQVVVNLFAQVCVGMGLAQHNH